MSVAGGAQRRSDLVVKARELVRLSRKLGYRTEELAEIIKQVS